MSCSPDGGWKSVLNHWRAGPTLPKLGPKAPMRRMAGNAGRGISMHGGKWSLAIAAMFVGALATGATNAKTYPTRPIRLIVPFSPGTSPDIIARALAKDLSTDVGQSIVVINQEGASGSIGFADVANAAPDGYTLAFGPQGPLTVQPFVKRNPPYKLESFLPLCQVYEDVFALFVGPNSPIADLNDLLRRAREKPKSLTFGSPGVATVPHLQVESLMLGAKFAMNHAPYRSVAQLIQDVMGGNLDLAVGSVASIRSSNARILAILGDARSTVYPNAPLIGDLGYTVSKTSFVGLYAPRATPEAISARLEKACEKIHATEAFQKMEIELGALPRLLLGKDYAKRLEDDALDKASLIKTLNIVQE
jgi:tripartite-type tricarboxylate transporter receptor subunit TctC